MGNCASQSPPQPTHKRNASARGVPATATAAEQERFPYASTASSSAQAETTVSTAATTTRRQQFREPPSLTTSASVRPCARAGTPEGAQRQQQQRLTVKPSGGPASGGQSQEAPSRATATPHHRREAVHKESCEALGGVGPLGAARPRERELRPPPNLPYLGHLLKTEPQAGVHEGGALVEARARLARNRGQRDTPPRSRGDAALPSTDKPLAHAPNPPQGATGETRGQEAVQTATAPPRRGGTIPVGGMRDQAAARQAELHRAACDGDAARVRELAADGADVNLCEAGSFGRSPLYRSVFNSSIPTVVALLEAGANPYQEDEDGLTPLQRAQEEGHTEIVKLMRTVRASRATGPLPPPPTPPRSSSSKLPRRATPPRSPSFTPPRAAQIPTDPGPHRLHPTDCIPQPRSSSSKLPRGATPPRSATRLATPPRAPPRPLPQTATTRTALAPHSPDRVAAPGPSDCQTINGYQGQVNPDSRWVEFSWSGQKVYMHADTEVMTLQPPAKGVKSRVDHPNPDQFGVMFATAAKADAGGINPQSSWHKVTCSGKTVYRAPDGAVSSCGLEMGGCDRCSLRAPAEGVKIDVEMDDAEEFQYYFAMAERMDVTFDMLHRLHAAIVEQMESIDSAEQLKAA
jgi:hypothetical protein